MHNFNVFIPECGSLGTRLLPLSNLVSSKLVENKILSDEVPELGPSSSFLRENVARNLGVLWVCLQLHGGDVEWYCREEGGGRDDNGDG